MPPFAVPSSLVRIMPRDADSGSKLARLREAVLPGGGVHYQQHVMRRAGNYLCGSALHLFEFEHQVGFCVQAACGIHNHRVRATGFRRGHRVEYDRCRIGAGFLLDDFDAVALGPDLELLDCGGTKRVCCT